MIGSLRGILAQKSPQSILVDLAGIGFEVMVPLSTLYGLPEPGQEVRLLVHTHVRENQILLVGFLREEEREIFRFLTGVTGIGPRLALNILSALPPEEIMEAIFQGDAQKLRAVPGVGRKTAERILVELKDRIPPREIRMGRVVELRGADRQVILETLSALVNLGYNRGEADKAVARVLEARPNTAGLRVETLLKEALRCLAR